MPARSPCDEPPPDALRRGIAEFNAGLFFEQHETLEDLWHAEPRPVRDLYQGILQIGVGLHHRRRGNHHGAVTLLAKGIALLHDYTGVCQGVDLSRLVVDATTVLTELELLGAARMAEACVPAPFVRESAS